MSKSILKVFYWVGTTKIDSDKEQGIQVKWFLGLEIINLFQEQIKAKIS